MTTRIELHCLAQLLALAVLSASACTSDPIRPAAPRSAGTVFTDCPDCPAMVVVPAGRFEMGADGGEPERYEGPVRTIDIVRPFAAGRFEITQAEYRRFAEATSRPASVGCYAAVDGGYRALPNTDWRDPGYGRTPADSDPVACVSWNDAKAYVTWLAARTRQPYRLLTESEWEYAARAGRTGRFAWGDDPAVACREANVFDATAAKTNRMPIPVAPCDDGVAGVAAVGGRSPNPYGLYDVIGNVWEWVEDCYQMPHPVDAPRDGRAQLLEGCDRRSVRGGSWISSIERQRPTFRGRDPADLTSQIFGFRIARDMP